jgi:hypothetical protein
MNVSMNDPTNHKVYGYVTEEYFYKVLQRAKVENLYADEHGRIDINKLIQLMWETFADGKYIIIPNHECRSKIVEFINGLSACDDAKVEAIAEMIIDAKPKRKSRAKPKVDEVTAEMSTEDLKENS